MIVTFMSDDKRLDVMIRPEQKIEEVFQRLLDRGYFSATGCKKQTKVFSLRQVRYINPMLTFRQGGIYGGDILLVEGGDRTSFGD